MPKPHPNTESKKEFVQRCIPELINEGKPQDQATAICYSIWKNSKQKAKGSFEINDDEFLIN